MKTLLFAIGVSQWWCRRMHKAIHQHAIHTADGNYWITCERCRMGYVAHGRSKR
jgi:hypothetical protein